MGRTQEKDEAEKLDEKLKQLFFFNSLQIDMLVDGDEEAPKKIFDYIRARALFS